MRLTALAVVILALGIIAGFALAGRASERPVSADLSIPSARVTILSVEVTRNEPALVDVSVTPLSATLVGSVSLTITYESGIVLQACTARVGVCYIAFGPNTAKIAAAAIFGMSGSIATLTFGTPSEGNFSVSLVGMECGDTTGLVEISCVAQNGVVSVESPVTQPPVTQPPVTQPPVRQPPVAQPPVAQPPVTQQSTKTATPRPTSETPSASASPDSPTSPSPSQSATPTPTLRPGGGPADIESPGSTTSVNWLGVLLLGGLALPLIAFAGYTLIVRRRRSTI